MLEFYALEIYFCLLELALQFGRNWYFLTSFPHFLFPLICNPLISDV